MQSTSRDPYLECEGGHCHHELARAVGLDELWGDDGPFPPPVLVTVPPASSWDPDPEPVQQCWAI